jgi:hypothetical protein
MTLIFGFLLVAGANPYNVAHPYPNMEIMGSGGGSFAGDVCLNDDIDLGFGTGTTAACGDEDYHIVYNSSSGAFQIWAWDCDGSSTACAWFQVADGTDDVLLTGTVNGLAAATDVAARIFGVAGANSWAQATGGNQTGGALRLSGGTGTRQIICSDRTLADTDTVTITVDGAATVLVESTDFDCEGEASEEVCCDNLGAAITTADIGITPDCATTAGTCYLTPAARLASVSVALADGGVNGVFGTATNGTDGSVVLGGVDPTLATLDGDLTVAPVGGDTSVTGTLTVSGTSDLESYAMVGNALALDSNMTLGVARNFTAASGSPSQMFVDGTITVTGGTGSIYGAACLMPTGVVINSGNVHPYVYTLDVREPIITETSGSCTDGGVVRIQAAPTECDTNQSLWVEGASLFSASVKVDQTGSNTNSPSVSWTGDNAGNEVECSIFTAYGAQPYMVISCDDDGTTPVLTQIVHLDDNSLRPASAGLITAGSVSNYFSDVIAAELSCLDSDVSNQLSIDWSEDDSSDRTLSFAVNSGNRSISLSGNLTVEAAATINQDTTTDGTPQFATLTLTTGPMLVTSDTNGYCRGAGDCADAKDFFNGTDWLLQCPGCVNGIQFDAPIIVGVVEVDADSGEVPIYNQEVTASSGDGTAIGHLFRIDSNNVFEPWAESDGAGSIDEIGTRYFYFNGAYSLCTTNQETLTFAGGGGDVSKTTSGLIPVGATSIVVMARTLVTGTTCTSADYGDGSTVDLYGDNIAVSAGTTLSSDDYTSDIAYNASSAEEVTITGVGGNCVSLSVRVLAAYCTHTAPTN